MFVIFLFIFCSSHFSFCSFVQLFICLHFLVLLFCISFHFSLWVFLFSLFFFFSHFRFFMTFFGFFILCSSFYLISAQVWGRVATEIAQTLVSVQLPSAVHNCTACVWTMVRNIFRTQKNRFKIKNAVSHHRQHRKRYFLSLKPVSK